MRMIISIVLSGDLHLPTAAHVLPWVVGITTISQRRCLYSQL